MERETVRKEGMSLFLPIWAIAAVIKKMTPVAKAQRAKVLKTWALGTNEENKVNKTGCPNNPKATRNILSIFNSVSL